MFDLIFAIIGGAIIGWFGTKVARGNVRIPTWLTIACGIGGIYLGNFLYTLFFEDNTAGFDWWRHTWQVVVAAVLVSAVANHRSKTRTSVRV